MRLRRSNLGKNAKIKWRKTTETEVREWEKCERKEMGKIRNWCSGRIMRKTKKERIVEIQKDMWKTGK